MTNKEILKKLNKEIRLKKDARKPSHPHHKTFFPYYVPRVQDWKIRWEARCRSIIQAFKNRNIVVEKLSLLQFVEYMKQIGCEQNIKVNTSRIILADLQKFLEDDE